MTTVFDIGIIGLGVIGLSTAYQASKRGISVIGFEQFDPLHDQGSSHGESRLTRQAYSEGLAYVPLALDAHREWDALSREVQRPLLHRSGVIYVSDDPSHDPVVLGAHEAAKTYDIAGVEVFNAQSNAEWHKRFPGMKFRSNEGALWESQAGWLEADAIRSALRERAVARGADLRYRCRVLKWTTLSNGHIVVHCDQQQAFHCRSLVLAAGSWTRSVIPQADLSLHPKRRVLSWYEVDPAHVQERIRGPGFLIQRDGQLLYGFPAVFQEHEGHKRWLVKAALHYAPYLTKSGTSIVDEADCDPDTVSRAVNEEEVSKFDPMIRDLFRGIGRRVRSKVCLYTNTDDGHFVIDTLPSQRNVVVAAGFSGHGFKFGITIGKILTNLALGKDPGFDISLFSIKRPALKAKL